METGLFCILVKYTHPNSFAVDLAPLLCPICFVPPLPPPLSMAQLLQNIFNATGQSIDSVGGEFITTISKYINRAQLYINNSSEKVKNVLKTYLEYFDIYNNKDDDGEENAINDYVNNKRDTLKRINRLNAWQGENNMNNIVVASSLTSTNYMITWHLISQDGSGYGIYAKIYDPTIVINSDYQQNTIAFQINTYTNLDQLNSVTALLANGQIAVVWQSDSQDSSGFGIYGQILNPDGTKFGKEFQINLYVTYDQKLPSILAFDDGTFVVSWQCMSQHRVYGSIFQPDGTRIGSEFRISTIYGNTNVRISKLSGQTWIAVYDGYNRPPYFQIFYNNLKHLQKLFFHNTSYDQYIQI